MNIKYINTMSEDEFNQIAQLQAIQTKLYLDIKSLQDENRQLKGQLLQVNRIITILDRSYTCLVHHRLDPQEFSKYLLRLCQVKG